MAPSMIEYHIEQLLNNIESNAILNKHNIQDTINLDAYTLYLDYSDNIYIEQDIIEDEYATASLW
jgi:ferric iron reductase protein FhuF